MSVSERVVLRLALPDDIVTWFVTGSAGCCPRSPEDFGAAGLAPADGEPTDDPVSRGYVERREDPYTAGPGAPTSPGRPRKRPRQSGGVPDQTGTSEVLVTPRGLICAAASKLSLNWTSR